MSQIDIQYLYNISPRLDRFKKKSQNLYNFRCVYCGDSQKNKTKARAYVYRSKNDLFYKCHNCGKGTTLGKLVEYVDPQLYKSYVLEKYKGGRRNSTEPDFKFEPVKFDDKILKDLKRLDNIPEHAAYDLFIKKRKLEEHADKFYITWHFMSWVNTIIPNKFPKIKEDHPRVVIPFYDVNGKVFAFQGRAFGNEEPKYITIKLDENKRRIYGLDRLDVNKKIYITEGPIDSLYSKKILCISLTTNPEIKRLLTK
jgi:transcription elongation factor Elf1